MSAEFLMLLYFLRVHLNWKMVLESPDYYRLEISTRSCRLFKGFSVHYKDSYNATGNWTHLSKC